MGTAKTHGSMEEGRGWEWRRAEGGRQSPDKNNRVGAAHWAPQMESPRCKIQSIAGTKATASNFEIAFWAQDGVSRYSRPISVLMHALLLFPYGVRAEGTQTATQGGLNWRNMDAHENGQANPPHSSLTPFPSTFSYPSLSFLTSPMPRCLAGDIYLLACYLHRLVLCLCAAAATALLARGVHKPL